MKKVKSARLTPESSLQLLSQLEVKRLAQNASNDLFETFRHCALAVLNTGNPSDNSKAILEAYKDFAIDIIQQERGVKLEVHNAPQNAFVDGEMIRGIKEHLFSALRDLIYIDNELAANNAIDFSSTTGITNAVFHITRNAGLLEGNKDVNLVVCWGGHSINGAEYDYTKKVGYELGLRGLDICTGCGPGAMKGPMKGATIAHAKQRRQGRYIGITEPGIIAAESPNPIVNDLVIMPDIEKRLEAFVRVGHGIVVFPGGVGTAEEILYLLGILLNPENKHQPFPLIFTGPESSRQYFEQIHQFIGQTIGEKAQSLYKIIIDSPTEVATLMNKQLHEVQDYRRAVQDAYYYNWVLKISEDFQKPFQPTHENMCALDLTYDQNEHDLASNLRKAFSGIVDGNVKVHGIKAVEALGPYEIRGDKGLLKHLDNLLCSFIEQGRMNIDGGYEPCYRIIS